MCGFCLAKVGLSDFKSIGYISSWGDMANINKINYNNLTHVIYAFAIPKTDGSGELLPLEGASDRVPLLKQKCSNAGVKLLLGVGGWSANGVELYPVFDQATSTAEKRTLLTKNIMKMVRENGFEGVDVDWEYPFYGYNDRAYNQFLLELHDSLAKAGKMIVASVISDSTAGGIVLDQNTIDSLDLIMPLIHWNQADEWMPYYARRVPKEKLAMGVIFHGFLYGQYAWKSYADLLKAGANPYDSSFGGTEYQGINKMMNTVLPTAWKYANGVLIWELNQDYYGDSTFSLLKAVGDGIRALDPLWREANIPYVKIKNVATGTYLRDRGANLLGLDAVNEEDTAFNSSQQWKLIQGSYDVFQIQNKKTGLVTDVFYGSKSPGSFLGTWNNLNQENQKVTFERWSNTESRGYYIRNYVFQPESRVMNYRNSDGQVIISDYDPNVQSQKWTVERPARTQRSWVSPYVSSSSSSTTAPVNCASVARWDANTPWTDYSAGAYRQHNGYVWVVISPGYAIYEPGSAYGVYGWAQKGPCQ